MAGDGRIVCDQGAGISGSGDAALEWNLACWDVVRIDGLIITRRSSSVRRIGHLLYEIPIILGISGAITGVFASTGQFFNLGLVVCIKLNSYMIIA